MRDHDPVETSRAGLAQVTLKGRELRGNRLQRELKIEPDFLKLQTLLRIRLGRQLLQIEERLANPGNLIGKRLIVWHGPVPRHK